MAQPSLPRIFLDSSVLFAAAASATGASRAFIVLAELRLVRLVVCQQVFDEVQRNLSNKVPAAVPYFQRLQSALDWEIVPDPSPAEVQACVRIIAEKDAPILAAALAAKPHRLVTLDTRDFTTTVQSQINFPIQTPGELLTDIRQILIQHLRTTP